VVIRYPGQAAVVGGHPQPVIGGGNADAHAQARDGSLVNVASEAVTSDQDRPSSAVPSSASFW